MAGLRGLIFFRFPRTVAPGWSQISHEGEFDVSTIMHYGCYQRAYALFNRDKTHTYIIEINRHVDRPQLVFAPFGVGFAVPNTYTNPVSVRCTLAEAQHIHNEIIKLKSDLYNATQKLQKTLLTN